MDTPYKVPFLHTSGLFHQSGSTALAQRRQTLATAAGSLEHTYYAEYKDKVIMGHI